MIRQVFLSSALSLVISTSVNASPREIKREVSFFTETASGITFSCGTEYVYTFADELYSAGKIVSVVASTSLFQKQGHFIFLIKITGIDFPSGPENGISKIFPIKGTTIKFGTNILRPQAIQCEKNDGSYCGVLRDKDAIDMIIATNDDKYQKNYDTNLLFARQNGLIDYDLPIDNKPSSDQNKEKYSSEMIGHKTCISDIISKARSDLK